MRKRWLAGAGAALILTLAFLMVSNALSSARPGNHGKNIPLVTVQYQGDAKPWHAASKTGDVKEATNLPVAVEDPMENVSTFLQRNQKEAENSIKALTQEAESLRARLQKVEAALEKWQGVAKALQQEANLPVATPEPDDPILMPVPSASPDLPPASGVIPAGPPAPNQAPCPVLVPDSGDAFKLPSQSSPAPPLAVPADPNNPATTLPPIDPGDAFKLPSQIAPTPPLAVPADPNNSIPILPAPEPPTLPSGPVMSFRKLAPKACQTIRLRPLGPSPMKIAKLSSRS